MLYRTNAELVPGFRFGADDTTSSVSCTRSNPSDSDLSSRLDRAGTYVTGNLVWMDLEMTGLDPEHDVILEMASIVTDADLNVIAEGPEIAIAHTGSRTRGDGRLERQAPHRVRSARARAQRRHQHHGSRGGDARVPRTPR